MITISLLVLCIVYGTVKTFIEYGPEIFRQWKQRRLKGKDYESKI